MRIAVCMKQIPSSATQGFDPNTNTLIREQGTLMTNLADVYALESALTLAGQDGTADVFTMGKSSACALLRDACALGAKGLFLINDPLFAGSDTFVTAKILAAAIKHEGSYDLILCGRRTLDGETGQVGGQLAAVLEVPCVTNVIRLEQSGERAIRCTRLLEETRQMVETDFPAVVTVCEGVEEVGHPRLPSLRGIRAAGHAQIKRITNETLQLNPGSVGLAGSFTRVEQTFLLAAGRRRCKPEPNLENGVARLLTLIESMRIGGEER